jgi:hypothetical protein
MSVASRPSTALVALIYGRRRYRRAAPLSSPQGSTVSWDLPGGEPMSGGGSQRAHGRRDVSSPLPNPAGRSASRLRDRVS